MQDRLNSLGSGKIFSLVVVGFLFVATLLTFNQIQRPQKLASHAQTVGVSLSFAPAASSIQSGQTIIVQVREDSGTSAVNAVQANIAYDSSKLDLVSVSYSGSAFSIQAEETRGAGTIHLARGTLVPVVGDQLIATLTLSAKTLISTATAAVSFDPTSRVVSSTSNTNILTVRNSAAYTVEAGAPITSSTASLSFSPSTGTVAPNGTIALQVREDSGTSAVNAVQANITYDQTKFDVSSLSYSGSAFSIQAEETRGAGTIHLARGTTTPVTGNQLVAVVTLKAKALTVTSFTTVAFDATSAVVMSSTNSNILSTRNGGTYTIQVASAGTATPTPTQPATATPTSTVHITPVPTPTTIVKFSKLGFAKIGEHEDQCDSYYVNVTKWKMGARNGRVVSMSTYVGHVDDSPNNLYKLGIYEDNHGAPGTLIAQSNEGVLRADSWNTLPISASLKARKFYWLAYNTNGTTCSDNNMRYDDPWWGIWGNKGGWTTDGAPFDSWPSPFGEFTGSNQKFSLYASFLLQ